MTPIGSNDSPVPSRSITVNGRKFLWDGSLFDSHQAASSQAEAYKNDGFEVHLCEQGERHLVFTRRIVKEVVTSP
jgi:hypothetical protein